ncbi:MAG: hypothetical protein JO274_05200, partial [Gammaproteobacteria bacterium]|nr:hypothetical protein [Gammaproteobacteria bacterium]
MSASALLDRVAEIPYRLGKPAHAQSLTWPVSPEQLASLTVVWPTRYEWAGCAGILETIKDALQRLGILREEPSRQSFKGAVMLKCILRGEAHAVALDYSDYHDFINPEALAQSE